MKNKEVTAIAVFWLMIGLISGSILASITYTYNNYNTISFKCNMPYIYGSNITDVKVTHTNSTIDMVIHTTHTIYICKTNLGENLNMFG